MRRWIAVACLTLLVGGCASSASDSSPGSTETAAVQPFALPDLSRVSWSVQEQIHAQHALLTETLENPRARATERGTAYGQMGTLLMAAQLFDAAETCFTNARVLDPGDVRWRYYLGHVHRSMGAHEASVTFFEQVLDQVPDDVPALVWLGYAYIELDRPEAAEPPLARALELEPDLAAARAGLGRAALAQRQYAPAVEQLEAALASAPGATSLHYLLGMAYRGMGALDAAEVHLDQRGDIEVLFPDPLMRELNGLLRSATAYESSGIRALELEEWAAAAAAFRQGLELEPDSPSLRHRLGTALIMTGDAVAAVEQFEKATRLAPEFAQAHYSLGVIEASAGRYAEAISRFSAAVRHEPTYVEARAGLADLLRQTGRIEESLPHYARVLDEDPRVTDAWLGYALALIRLERYASARDRLVEATRLHAGDPDLSHALARLLAAAPDDLVRDGARAMALMEGLLAGPRSVDLGETMAMVLAEVGNYAEAAALQRELIAVAEQQMADLVPGMTENLRLYEQGQPCRIPWRDGEMP